MAFFKAIAVGIGWLSSSLAGIGAIFYACGFLINRFQSNLLGIDKIIQFKHEQFIQEGGKFILALGIELGNIFFNLLLVLFVVIVIIWLPLQLIAYFRKQSITSFWTEKTANFRHRFHHNPSFFKITLYSVVLCLLFLSSEDPQSLDDPLEISNLLYVSNKNLAYQEPVEKLHQLITQGETKKLKTYYTHTLIFWLKAIFLLFIAWRITTSWKYRSFARAPFIIIVSLYTLLLPMLYGVLQKPISFPVIKIILKDQSSTKLNHKLFLLSKTDAEFIIWNSVSKTVLWIPTKEIKSAELTQLELLFNPAIKNNSKNSLTEKL